MVGDCINRHLPLFSIYKRLHKACVSVSTEDFTLAESMIGEHIIKENTTPALEHKYMSCRIMGFPLVITTLSLSYIELFICRFKKLYLGGEHHYHLFTVGETEAERRKVTCPGQWPSWK